MNGTSRLGLIDPARSLEVRDALEGGLLRGNGPKVIEDRRDVEAIAIYDKLIKLLYSGRRLSEMWAALRHVVYESGIGYSDDEIDAIAVHILSDVLGRKVDQDGDYQDVLIWRTAYALRILASVAPNLRGQHLGLFEAQYLKPDFDGVKAKYFNLDELGTPISVKPGAFPKGGTPVNELIDLIQLAEEIYPKNELVIATADACREYLVKIVVTSKKDDANLVRQLFRARHYRRIIKQMQARIPDHVCHWDGVNTLGGKGTGLSIAFAALERDDDAVKAFDKWFVSKQPRYVQAMIDRNPSILERVNPHVENSCVKRVPTHSVGPWQFERVVQDNPVLAEAGTLKSYYINDSEVPEGMHERINTAMLNAKFPRRLERQHRMDLQRFRKEWGAVPIVVRSSGLLEDQKNTSFSGIYDSQFVPYVEDFDQHFKLYLQAVRKVYSSVFTERAMEYRKDVGLLWENEQMALTVMPAVGERRGDYFVTDMAAVMYSRLVQTQGGGAYRGGGQICAGYGETIVAKNQGRPISFENPRQTFENFKSQENIICVNMNSADPEHSIEISKFRKACEGLPEGMHQLVRLVDNTRYLATEADSTYWDKHKCALSFGGVLDVTEDPLLIRLEYIVQRLKWQLGVEVDCEFAFQYHGRFGWQIYLLQCRPYNIHPNINPSRMPEDVPEENILIRGNQACNALKLKDAEYVVWFDPDIYSVHARQASGVDDMKRDDYFTFVDVYNVRKELEEYLEYIDKQLPKTGYVVLAPGGWGTKDKNGGVPVMPEIHAGCIFELESTLMKSSQGSHEFNRAVEKGCGYAKSHLTDLNKPEFFSEASPASGIISFAEYLRTVKNRPDMATKIANHIKVINVREATQAAYGEEMLLNIASDNFTEPTDEFDEDAYPTSMWLSKPGENQPVAVEDTTFSKLPAA